MLFLCRLLKSTLQEFSQWVHNYIQRTESMQYNQSLRAHVVFYSVCQAIFYVVAFRSKQLTSSAKNLIFLQSLQLSSIVTCHLNPLRVCLPAVATAFAGVTRAHQLAYCHRSWNGTPGENWQSSTKTNSKPLMNAWTRSSHSIHTC